MLRERLCRLGSFYNALPNEEMKNEVQQWAEANYPDVWGQLQKLERGRRVRWGEDRGPTFEGVEAELRA